MARALGAMSSTQTSPNSRDTSNLSNDVPTEWIQSPLRRLDLEEPGPQPDPIEDADAQCAASATRTTTAPQTRNGEDIPVTETVGASSSGEFVAGPTRRSTSPRMSPASRGPYSYGTTSQTGVAHPVHTHCYAVWHTTGQRDIRGVHVGGKHVWTHIVQSLPNAEWSPSERLRRFGSEQEAVAGYIAEARRHGAPLPPPRYFY